jgi:DNA-binding NtrC family response regulator
MKKILIVDDDVAVTNYLMVFLMQTGRFETTVVNDSREVPDLLSSENFDVLLLDMDMPNVSGMKILEIMGERNDHTPVVVLTGVSDVDLAVKAMKQGAFDYLTKPVDDEYLVGVLDSAMEHGALHESIGRLPTKLKREDLTHEDAFSHFPTRDPAMIRIFHRAEAMASGDLCVYIWGERGTGKEDLARAIHKVSQRRDGPFVTADAAAQKPEEFSAALFGRAKDWSGKKEEKNGFLDEAAGGTLFLDEIEYLTFPVQIRLKRVIQKGEYYKDNATQIKKIDVRFIAASEEDLTSDRFKNSFSRDLLYHLMVNSIHIPPLRDRKEDIPLLAEFLLKQELEKASKPISGFSPEYLELLKNYDFPDNIQELRTIVAGSIVNEKSERVTVDSLPPYIRKKIIEVEEKEEAEEIFKPRKLSDVKRDHVQKMLEHFGGDREKAAVELGIPLNEIDEILSGKGS